MIKELKKTSPDTKVRDEEYEAVLRDARLLDMDGIHEPDDSVEVFIESGFAIVEAATVNFVSLARVGVTRERIRQLKARLRALQSVQRKWDEESMFTVSTGGTEVVDTAVLDAKLANYRELRNRIYTITKASVQALQMFAAFAFGRDPNDDRRSLFGFQNGRSPEEPVQKSGLFRRIFLPFA